MTEYLPDSCSYQRQACWRPGRPHILQAVAALPPRAALLGENLRCSQRRVHLWTSNRLPMGTVGSTPSASALVKGNYLLPEEVHGRLNKIHYLWRTPFRGYMAHWNQYGSFFGDNFAWLPSSTVYVAIVLTAMQAGLATELQENTALQSALNGVTFPSWGTRRRRLRNGRVLLYVYQQLGRYEVLHKGEMGKGQDVGLRLSKTTELSWTLAGHVLLPSSRLARFIVRSGVQQSLEASTREVSSEGVSPI
ncbi:uncharacterized protein VDAG_09160 [Verticillium dahliae VdLs.17]|uniref:Uncharacterized protein n=1 Tax=Verticillium dahliae (strain VdLs.17 / ATCC MYA-4575 / FGSC 10137) TaxID=498257 RepID=G2XFN6_VERDV|nr:uncharacterized protein VDAG_09160 [Verticillium dahliae VdLs.17]EGY18634.1 hypothetical protein VDAG_09160 [Verticillium dahliae VdLs.17]